MASFHNTFSNITQHSDLLLEWDHANATDYPLIIHARLLNRTNEYEVNTLEADISGSLIDDSFLWEDLPSPLPFFPTAMYELCVLRQSQWLVGDVTPGLAVACSPPFTIVSRSGGDDDDYDDHWQTPMNETASDPAGSMNSSYSHGRPRSTITAIAAGVVVPLIVIGISAFVFVCMRRRRKRTQEERRKEREGLVIE